MDPALNTTTNVTPEQSLWYSRMLLERAIPRLFHDRFGVVKDLPLNNSDTIKFRRFENLDEATTPLTEGVTPTGTQLSITDVMATVAQYGAYVPVSDFVLDIDLSPILMEVAEQLGEQAGKTIDTIYRNVINAGTTVRYADVSAPKANNSRDDIVTATDIIAADELRLAIRDLKNNDAMEITQMVSADRGYGTTPVMPAFVAIVHPNVSLTLKGITGFQSLATYQAQTTPMPGEIGKFEEVRFLETTHAKVFAGEGAAGGDVYSTLFIAARAYGITRLAGRGLQNIVKAIGSAGAADPLNQRGTSGWKAAIACARLNESWLLRLESSVAA